jgi:FAD/FMN-containing dehydrogenase
VTPPADGPPVVTLNLGKLDKVLEIDRASRAARIQAGVFGPALENQLRPHKLTLRHFPQSFEYSTTRSSRAAARSRTITRLGESTDPGTTGSARTCSRRR